MDTKETAPWTLKSISPKIRKLALTQASKAELSVSEWVSRAIESQARTDAGNAVLPPASTALIAAPEPGSTSLSPHQSYADQSRELPGIDMHAMTEFISVLIQVMPEGKERDRVLRELSATARTYLRVARGVRPRQQP